MPKPQIEAAMPRRTSAMARSVVRIQVLVDAARRIHRHAALANGFGQGLQAMHISQDLQQARMRILSQQVVGLKRQHTLPGKQGTGVKPRSFGCGCQGLVKCGVSRTHRLLRIQQRKSLLRCTL